MAVAIDAIGTSNLADATTGTTADQAKITVGATATTLVFFVQIDIPDSSTITANWDSAGTNQPMTNIVDFTDGANNGRVMIFGLRNPTPGLKNLHIVTSGTIGDISLHAMSFTGGNVTSDVAAFPHTGTNTGTSTTPAVTVTSATGNYAGAGYTQRGAGILTVDHTQLYIENSGATRNGAANYDVGAASLTFNATLNTPTTSWAAVAVDIAAAGAPTAVLEFDNSSAHITKKITAVAY